MLREEEFLIALRGHNLEFKLRYLNPRPTKPFL